MRIKERGEAGRDSLRAEWKRVVSKKYLVAAKCGLGCLESTKHHHVMGELKVLSGSLYDIILIILLNLHSCHR